ncbi:sugar transferase [cyanobacterium endosymbiont of Epithemia turgida]|uniref:sugar transferase n=1 Tax=cyanobacterium endosymbiont of Epithemia turgida TaxID=718217 RepID=UPI000870A924|nr:sugar transferase [cyanobacterium endosymbiont of Epithemia turgida]
MEWVITGALLIPIFIAIEIDIPGAIFFKQISYGWWETRFKTIKIRSTYINTEAHKHKIYNEVQGAILKIMNVRKL